MHGREDRIVSIEISRSYRLLATAAAGDVDLVEIEGPAGSHRAHLDPRGRAWAEVTEQDSARTRRSGRASTSSRTP